MPWFGDHEDSYNNVCSFCCDVLQTLIAIMSQYQSAPKHEAHLSHELIAGAAAYEVRLRCPLVCL